MYYFDRDAGLLDKWFAGQSRWKQFIIHDLKFVYGFHRNNGATAYLEILPSGYKADPQTIDVGDVLQMHSPDDVWPICCVRGLHLSFATDFFDNKNLDIVVGFGDRVTDPEKAAFRFRRHIARYKLAMHRDNGRKQAKKFVEMIDQSYTKREFLERVKRTGWKVDESVTMREWRTCADHLGVWLQFCIMPGKASWYAGFSPYQKGYFPRKKYTEHDLRGLR